MTRVVLLIVFLATVGLMLAACQSQQPKLESASDYYAQAYSELTGAYNALVNATTPTAPGAQPLMGPTAAEIELARSEGRPPNVQRFKDAADAAQSAAHAHLDAMIG